MPLSRNQPPLSRVNMFRASLLLTIIGVNYSVTV